MAVIRLYDLARMTTATVGTGTITLGSAVAGFLSFAGAGVANAETVRYAIRDGANSEVGTGVYTSAGTTLTRTPIKSTNANAAINLSGIAEVAIVGAAEDFRQIYLDNGAAGTPSLTFASDDDTGLYRIGANNIGVAANGAKVLDIAATGLGVTGTLSVSGVASVTDATDAGAGTGALVVSGGGYFAKALRVNASTASTSTTTGALIVAGGAGIGGDLNWTGVNFTSYAPTIGFNTGSASVNLLQATYKRFGKMVLCQTRFVLSGTSGTPDYIKVPLPVSGGHAHPTAGNCIRGGRVEHPVSMNYYVGNTEANIFGQNGTSSAIIDGDYSMSILYESV